MACTHNVSSRYFGAVVLLIAATNSAAVFTRAGARIDNDILTLELLPLSRCADLSDHLVANVRDAHLIFACKSIPAKLAARMAGLKDGEQMDVTALFRDPSFDGLRFPETTPDCGPNESCLGRTPAAFFGGKFNVAGRQTQSLATADAVVREGVRGLRWTGRVVSAVGLEMVFYAAADENTVFDATAQSNLTQALAQSLEIQLGD